MATAQTAVLPAPPRRTTAGRAVAVSFGVVLATLGSVLALLGGGTLVVFGADGSLRSDREQISTPTAAFVTDVATIDDTATVSKVVGQPEFNVSAIAERGGPGVFVGVGPAADVDRYLAGAPIDRVDDIDMAPFSLSRDRRPGDAQPVPPESQSFWVAQSGNDMGASLDWRVRDGDYKVVVMNTDGSTDVSADAQIGITMPNLPELSLAGLAAGVLMLGGAAVAFLTGRRPRG
jgi:hypothetical protein